MIQQDMEIDCIVSNKVVDFAIKQDLKDTIESNTGQVINEPANQEELIVYLVNDMVPPNQQIEQLCLLSSNKAWRNECSEAEYSFHEIFVKEQLERRFLFRLRLNDD